MNFFIFYKIWFYTIIYENSKLLYGFFKITLNLLKKFSVEFWILLITSLLLLITIILPWFSYNIKLDDLQNITIRTKKWYLFMLPPITTIFFLFGFYYKRIYFIQLAINILVITLYVYGFFEHTIHISIKGEYKIKSMYYAYIIILIIHTTLLKILKNKKHFFCNQLLSIYRKWKKNLNLN